MYFTGISSSHSPENNPFSQGKLYLKKKQFSLVKLFYFFFAIPDIWVPPRNLAEKLPVISPHVLSNGF